MSFAAFKAAVTRPLTASELRLLAFAVVAPLAVWAGFIGPSVAQAEHIVSVYAYYVMLVAFSLFLVALARLWRARVPATHPVTRREAWLLAVAIAGFSWLAFNSEPLSAKVLNDEFVLQSTGFNLHYFREADTMVRGYDIDGVFLSVSNYFDKRPIFYPFLISLLHDVVGFNRWNAFLVNTALCPVLLWLTWWLARKFAGPRAGLLAVVLIGTLPLLGQNATGAGMELTNLVMIFGAAALALLYMEKPDELRLSALALALVLLCQSCYESAVFVGAGGLAVILGWWRAKRMVLSWPAVVAPLLLVPFALQHKVLANSPGMWELTEERSSRFSFDYLPDNLWHAWNFFSSGDINLGNSWYLSVLGLVGLMWLGVCMTRHRRLKLDGWRPDVLAVAPFVAAIVGNMGMVMAYYWANLDDPMASRFSLPLYVLLAILAAVALNRMDAKGWISRVAMGGALIFVLGGTVPRLARHAYSNLGIQELTWLVREAQTRGPGPRIVLSHRTSLIWLLEKTPAILLQRGKLMQDRLRYQLSHGMFEEILVTQELRPTSGEGQHQVITEDVLPATFHLEMIAQKRFGTKLLRISKIIAIDPPASSSTGTARPPVS